MSYFIFVLAFLGFYIAAYFWLVGRGLLKQDNRIVPSFCRLHEGTCRKVLETGYASIFGVQNSFLGIIYYSAVLIALGTGQWLTHWVSAALAAVSWFTTAVSLYLIHALFYRIKVPCPLCLVSHGINLALAIALTFAATH
ncbi:MAG: vitamin K epoxide reductase family protein [Armatimonadetes bacterium]|nr:vitamin K epoxide reductase family protein [Armatimonadota bacterium]